jgi:hypothetical protein
VADEGMSRRERRSYLRQMQPRYRQASKREKRDLLDEMERVTGMHRKSLTRLLNMTDLRPKPSSTGRRSGDKNLRKVVRRYVTSSFVISLSQFSVFAQSSLSAPYYRTRCGHQCHRADAGT